MTTWILIWWMTMIAGYPALATGSAQFASYEECEFARTEMVASPHLAPPNPDTRFGTDVADRLFIYARCFPSVATPTNG